MFQVPRRLPRRRASFRLVGPVALVALAGSPAFAATTVAVMPFKNLSSNKASVGEAIRETVTTDLRALGSGAGLTVIERSFIDKVLAEQGLQAQRADLDPQSAVRVGKLLGAELIAAGAYQEVGRQVRLTARFVRVETGQIVGSTKVDGPSGDFLDLQDKVTAELLRSAGISAVAQKKAGPAKRPRIRSLSTLSLYGDSLLASDDTRRRDLLKQALAADPDFVYAAHDLAELEQRLKGYDAADQAERAREARELMAQVDTEKDPQKRGMALFNLFNSFMQGRRYRKLITLARTVEQMPAQSLPPLPAGVPPILEQAGYYKVFAESMYSDWDAVLRDGEKFVAQFPGSPYFGGVRANVDKAISEKQFVEDGRASAKDEIAQLDGAQKESPCRLAVIYTRARQWAAAKKQLERATPGQCSVYEDELQWMQVGMATGDYKMAKAALARMKERDPKLYASYRMMESNFPAE